MSSFILIGSSIEMIKVLFVLKIIFKEIFMAYQGIRRKVFISHFKGDKTEVEAFIKKYGNEEKVFIPYVLGANNNDDFINSSNSDYVMNQIRKKYLQDTTITIVLIGNCTHSRRYVDWEIKSSLRQGEYMPNGLIGILLPSMGTAGHLPPRFKENWNNENKDSYARYYSYPTSPEALGRWIEDAYQARTSRKQFIKNSQEMMKYNAKCLVCKETH